MCGGGGCISFSLKNISSYYYYYFFVADWSSMMVLHIILLVAVALKTGKTAHGNSRRIR